MESMTHLGWIMGRGYRDVKALPILKRVLENRRETLGDDDPKTIDSLSALAAVISVTGDYTESETMQREALARSERVLGKKHSDTINCMGHLAGALRDQSKTEEAVKLLRDVYDAKKELLGDLNQSTLVVEANLALLLSNDHNTLEEALSLWRLNLRNTTEVLGPNHSVTLITATNFIKELERERKYAEARELCEKCLAKADDDFYKDNLHNQKLLKDINGIWQELIETDAGEETSRSE
ncbi:hypothetical protein ACHAPE_007331 [Trichoderma viride]